MRLSIVTAVLDSHEVVRRQAIHYKKMNLPENIELILVDDSSTPPIKDFPPFNIYRYDNPAEWTQPAARNFGVKQAKGERIIVTDIDHIVTRELIEYVLSRPDIDFMKFKREVAILNKDGELVQNYDAVRAYGYEKRRYRKNGFHIAPHTNSFAIRRDLYLELGGVSEKFVGTGKYPNREEVNIRGKLNGLRNEGKITILDADTEGDPRPTLYMIPNGRFCGDDDFNPFGLFHTLSRKHPDRIRLTNKEKARLRREA